MLSEQKITEFLNKVQNWPDEVSNVLQQAAIAAGSNFLVLNIYIDAEVGSDSNTGLTTSDPLATINRALVLHGLTGRFIRLNCQAGQTHEIATDVNNYAQRVEFTTWNVRGDFAELWITEGWAEYGYAGYKERYALIKNKTILTDLSTPYDANLDVISGILSKNSCEYVFEHILVETAEVPDGWEGNLKNGIIKRSDHRGVISLYGFNALVKANSPLLHTASGSGGIGSVELYRMALDLTAITGSASKKPSQFLIANENGRPFSLYDYIPPHTDSNIENDPEFLEKFVSTRNYSTADADENPINILCNRSLSRASVPIIA